MYSFIDTLSRVVGGYRRIAILGIGNELMGDDGLGVIATRRLSAMIGHNPDILILECGTTPESFTSTLLKFQPDLILILDAVDFGGPPGSISIFDVSIIDRVSISTHKPSLNIMARYLEMNGLKTRIMVLAIQPLSIAFRTGLSKKVEDSINLVLRYLVDVLDSRD
ncbi:MAG: hydrogenase maturation protease [Nitrososphaerota archaeon]|nr:hydrogenase maturation protease [Nitrososphaerota archaeon]